MPPTSTPSSPLPTSTPTPEPIWAPEDLQKPEDLNSYWSSQRVSSIGMATNGEEMAGSSKGMNSATG